MTSSPGINPPPPTGGSQRSSKYVHWSNLKTFPLQYGIDSLSMTHSCGDPGVELIVRFRVWNLSAPPAELPGARLNPTGAQCCSGTQGGHLLQFRKETRLSHDSISARILPEPRMERRKQASGTDPSALPPTGVTHR